jgi:hypothetical protein
VNEADDKELIDYLHRKSALSMGYKKVYIEAPPAELDRAIKARARRALKFLVPGILATCIAFGLVGGLIVGVDKFMGVAVKVERRNKALENPPVTVEINIPATAKNEKPASTQLTREQWQKKIDALNEAGKTTEAQAELRRFKKVYP